MTTRTMRMTRPMSIGPRSTTSTTTKMMRAGGTAMTLTMKMASGSKTSNATPTNTSRTTWMATTGAGLNTMVSQRQTHKHLLEPMRTPPMASRPTRSSMAARAKARARMMDAFVCGSKWHRAADCPMKGSTKGSSKGHGYKGKGNFGWRWRPFRSKCKGKGKGKYKEKGKGKSYGKHWYASTLPTVPRGLNISHGNPDASTTLTSTTRPQEYNISTPPDEEVRMTRSTSSTDPAEGQQPPAANQADKKHLGAFNFAFNFYEAADYFAVRGEKRRGLIIDPGAASGLIGCDTLKDITEHCIQPYGKHKDIVIDKNVTSPVSGVRGGSDRTLGQATLPLTTGGCPISVTGEVIGGEGSMCQALVGNPSLRKMNSTIFTNYFANGDGLLVLDSRAEDDSKLKMLRILLTDSGHYILPTDHNSTARVSQRDTAGSCSLLGQDGRPEPSEVE